MEIHLKLKTGSAFLYNIREYLSSSVGVSFLSYGLSSQFEYIPPPYLRLYYQTQSTANPTSREEELGFCSKKKTQLSTNGRSQSTIMLKTYGCNVEHLDQSKLAAKILQILSQRSYLFFHTRLAKLLILIRVNYPNGP